MITELHDAVSRLPALSRAPSIIQMLGTRSLFLARHPKGPLRFCSEDKGAKGLRGARQRLLESLGLRERCCVTRQSTKVVQWDSAT